MTSACRRDWARVELGSLAEFRNGINYNKSNFGKGISVISVKDFWERSFPRYDNLEQINPQGVVRREHLIQNKDILFVRSNGNRELIGRSLFVRNLPSRPVTHSAFTIRVRFTSSRADARYFSYVFRSPIIRQVLSAQGNGANISNLNQDILTRLKVDLPPNEVQVQIAATLSAYDNLIENNTRRIEILEEMARAIYEEWFVRFRFPGHESVRMVESELGVVPESWTVTTLGRLAEVNARSVRRGSEPTEVLYVDISSVSTGSIDKKERLLFANAPGRARRIVRDGDVIWACVRPNRKSYALVLNAESNLLVSTGFAVLSPVTAPWSFVYQCVTTDDFVSYLVNHAKGAAYPAVGAEDFENAKVLTPSMDFLTAFDRLVEPMMRLAAALQLQNANLRATRDLLLPKLISGELDVATLPEPEALAA